MTIETVIENIEGTDRTKYLVRVLHKNHLIAAASVVNDDIKKAGKQVMALLDSLVIETQTKLRNAGLL